MDKRILQPSPTSTWGQNRPPRLLDAAPKAPHTFGKHDNDLFLIRNCHISIISRRKKKSYQLTFGTRWNLLSNLPFSYSLVLFITRIFIVAARSGSSGKVAGTECPQEGLDRTGRIGVVKINKIWLWKFRTTVNLRKRNSYYVAYVAQSHLVGLCRL